MTLFGCPKVVIVTDLDCTPYLRLRGGGRGVGAGERGLELLDLGDVRVELGRVVGPGLDLALKSINGIDREMQS